jgi:glycosyltransferase involved in cell wall biosynthesis
VSSSVVLVDWLGRGGIAQCSEAWALELADASIDVAVVTRPGRELAVTAPAGERAPRGRIGAHRAVVSHAVETIRERTPGSVVVQDWVLPFLEGPVHRTARQVGAALVFVIHDHHLTTRVGGSRWGLRRLVRHADVLVAHTPFVAEQVRRATGRRDVRVVPLPRQRGMLDHPVATPALLARGDDLLALHFGVVRRRYKGGETVAALARASVPGWRFGVLGVGASTVGAAPELAIDRFLEPDELVATVAASDVSLLPYRTASQSAAVVLAQALGSVVVASAVGGIPDQIADGRTGVLMAPDAPLEAWIEVLHDLRDPALRRDLAAAARDHVDAQHAQFAASVRELAA